MTLNHELASGHAFTQHQLEVCYVPRISSQNPFLEQLEATVRNEVQKQLAEHREQEEKRTTFLAKAPLLRLASDILSFTLTAVLPPPTANNSMDIWSRPLARDKQFAAHVKKMCQRNNVQCRSSGLPLSSTRSGVTGTRLCMPLMGLFD
ncbi:hypothetical protein WJX77_001236 [Trebouxia sp. C0004]